MILLLVVSYSLAGTIIPFDNLTKNFKNIFLTVLIIIIVPIAILIELIIIYLPRKGKFIFKYPIGAFVLNVTILLGYILALWL